MSPGAREKVVQGGLVLAALAFLAVGVQGLLAPQRLLDPVSIRLDGVDAFNEARAMYGAFHLALAGAFLTGVFKPKLRRPLLGLWTLTVSSLVAGRLVSVALDGPPVALARGLLALEAVGIVAGVVLLRLCPPEAPPAGA